MVSQSAALLANNVRRRRIASGDCHLREVRTAWVIKTAAASSDSCLGTRGISRRQGSTEDTEAAPVGAPFRCPKRRRCSI
jgi:hypothetical protein